MSSSDAAATKEATKITALDHQSGKGAEAAASALNQDYNATLKADGNNVTQAKQWLQDTTAQLAANGVLPDVTIGVANGEIKDGHLSSDGQTLNGLSSLNFELATANPSAQTGQQAFDSVFVSDLANNTGNLNTKVNNELGANGAPINESEISSFQSNQNTVNQADGQLATVFGPAATKGSAQEQAAFASLDTASQGGKGDGLISKNDVQAAAKQGSAFNDQLLGMGYTQAQVAAADKSLTSLSNNWTADGNAGVLAKTSDGYDITQAQLKNDFGGSTATAGIANEVTATSAAAASSDGIPTDTPAPPPKTTTSASGESTLTVAGNKLTTTQESSLLNASAIKSGYGAQNVAENLLGSGASPSDIVAVGNDLQTLYTSQNSGNATFQVSKPGSGILNSSNEAAFIASLSAAQQQDIYANLTAASSST